MHDTLPARALSGVRAGVSIVEQRITHAGGDVATVATIGVTVVHTLDALVLPGGDGAAELTRTTILGTADRLRWIRCRELAAFAPAVAIRTARLTVRTARHAIAGSVTLTVARAWRPCRAIRDAARAASCAQPEP